MTEELTRLADLTPIGAILVIAALAQVAITQIAKQQTWTKQRTQAVAAALAGALGLLAAIVSGLIVGIPDSVIQVVSSILLSIAAVAVLGKTLYGVLRYVIPDGVERPDTLTVRFTETPPDGPVETVVPARGRRADRDGTLDSKVTLPTA